LSMQGFWIPLWTFIWFAGLTVFSVLSVFVIILGGKDLASLLRSLRERHRQQETSAEKTQ